MVTLRREASDDVPAVRALVAAAFGKPGADDEPAEVSLLDRLRASADWLPRLSLVAASSEGSVVGHVVCSRAWIESAEVVGLGPLAVRPDHQRSGIGTGLMHAVLGAAQSLDVPVVVLLGSTTYYPRFGFMPGAALGIESPEQAWGDHFQARVLTRGDHPRGAFRYAAAFRDL